MTKPIQQLPNWAKVLIRIILLPVAAILHFIPHFFGWVMALRNWVLYGGEFITYQKKDPATISDIYKKLVEQNK
jgi:hypothetical protein